MDHAAPPRRIFLPVRWLISPRDDLLWVLGSVVAAWALFAVWLGGYLSTASVFLVWVFAFHGPHFWATLSRTYADPEQRRQRRSLFRWSLVWFAVGPVVVGCGMLLKHYTGRGELIQLFFLGAAIWAFHHVVKQHFGFLALYRAKHQEFHRPDLLFHKYYLLISLWMPALIMLGTNNNWLVDVPFVYGYATSSDANFATLQGYQAQLRQVCTAVFWTAQAIYVGSLVWRLASGRGINLPLVLLIACCVPLTWSVIMLSLTSEIPGSHAVLVPILTTYHNIQYHGLVWHYNRTRLAPTAQETPPRQLGAAGWLNRNFLVYAGAGLLYTALTIGFEHYGIPIVTTGTWSPLFHAFFWGFAFHHYYLDAKIWKVSEDAELRRILHFPTRSPTAVATTGSATPAVTPETACVTEP